MRKISLRGSSQVRLAAINALGMNRPATLLAARIALARAVQPTGVPRPPLRYLAAELRELRHGLRLARVAPVGDAEPHPVLLVPGFFATPRRMWRMRMALQRAGHVVHDWPFGINLGATADRLDALSSQITTLAAQHDRPIALVGWSLGGLYAREAAKRCPDAVALVVTLGTPFSGDMRANNAWQTYQFVTGQTILDPPIPGDWSIKPPVPTVALWSPMDGIISPRSARGKPGERDAAHAIRCGHLGFVRDPKAIAQLCAVLARYPAA